MVRSVSHFALIPMVVIWFGRGEAAGSTPMCVHAVAHEIRSVDSCVTSNPHRVGSFLAPKVGMPVESIAVRIADGVLPISK